jgi:PhnB protein
MSKNMNYLPKDHNHVSPYLIVKNGEPLVQFIKDVFQADETLRFMNNDGGIIHVELKIKDSVIMIGEGGDQFETTNSLLHVYVEDVDSIYKKALECGGISITEPLDQPFGDRNATFKHPEGITWTVAKQISERPL